MEDHVTSSDMTGTGSSSVTTAAESKGTNLEPDLDLRVLCSKVKALEQNEVSTLQSDGYLRNRIGELERSERSLLLQLYQLASASHLPSMQHTHRLDQRLHMLRDEVRTMTREKERGECVWRERLQRCQRQLKAKEEEMSRQSQYFENFKGQLQQKLSLARDREQSLHNRIYTLEKQLLDLSVCAATGMPKISALRITAAGTAPHWEERERLPPTRGEGEGEEERKEERRKQWQPSVGTGMEKDVQEHQNSNETRLQGFILSLQEDLKALLEREEDGMTERRGLVEQLQEAQEKAHFLGCRVEEMKAEVLQLKVSEGSLMEDVEELREENQRLQQIVRDAANQAHSQSPVPSIPLPCTTATGYSSVGSLLMEHPTCDEATGHLDSLAVPPVHHRASGESTQKDQEDQPASAKPETPPTKAHMNLFHHHQSKANPSLRSLSGPLNEFNVGAWSSRGNLNLEEVSPSEESDALREAYMSLGFGEELEALQEQRDRLEVALQHTQEQLLLTAQENTRLKSQLRKDAEVDQGSTREKTKISTLPSSVEVENSTILPIAEDTLVQALNEENRALAYRIQELVAHVELREEEMKREETQLREQITKLGVERVRLEQDNQEQGCLITELNKKTEDDLNTIMELKQRLAESGQGTEESQADKELCVSGMQGECVVLSGLFHQNNLEECVDSLVESVLKGEEPQSTSYQLADDLTTASAPGSQHDNPDDRLQNSLQSSQLTKLVQSLKSKQEELSGDVTSLREQQKEVALSVQTQTEAKQQLTRAVWGLKEEKDKISQSLAALKQEREQLSRTVCVLRDEKEQFTRSMSALKEDKERLSQSSSGLQRANNELLQSLSSGTEERDQTVQSLQRLRAESDQLSQAVLCLKRERDELKDSLRCLKEHRDAEQSSQTLQEGRDELTTSARSLKEEKERTEHSIGCLKREERQIQLLLQGLGEERDSLQAALYGQTQTEEKNHKQHLLKTKKADIREYASQTCQTDDHSGHFVEEQRDLMKEIEALGAELKRSRDELEKSHVDTMRLHGELCDSEARRVEAEREADKGMRLMDVANQMEETSKENDSLVTQVKELQSKVTGLVREKKEALSLKAHTEEHYNILTAQLKAKTVALEELNSEYIALKRGQNNKEDLSTVLVSLRTRYNDIRAKYDALLKKRSQKDLDLAPLKAKLSCLVVKCLERNSLLVQMMKAMQSRGCVDSTLTHQVEQLLSDTALQDYTAAFTPGSGLKTRGYNPGLTQGFISKCPDYTGGFTPDQTCSAIAPHINQPNGFTPDSAVKGKDLKSERITTLVTIESTLQHQDHSRDVIPVTAETPMKNPSSPVPTRTCHQATPSPAPTVNEDCITSKEQLSPSAIGPENCGNHLQDLKGKSSPGPTGQTVSSLSPTPHSSSAYVGVSRRLSSPEKILNLHEQLQKTLMSSYQAPTIRGRGEQPKKCVSFSAAADVVPASQTRKQSLSFNAPRTNSVPLTTPLCQAKQTAAVKAPPVATNKSNTLFNAVASRSANVQFSPNMFTRHPLKADISKTTAPPGSPSEAKSTSSVGANRTISPKQMKDISDAKYAASSPVTLRTTSLNSDVLIGIDTNLKTTASDTQTAPRISTAPTANPLKAFGAVPAYDGPLFTASCTQSARCSPERSIKSATKSNSAPENTKTARSKPGAPAEVRSVEVIKTVGQSSLMIGWERPPLDELGCSNGTFVYGYRVFVNGDFHKSVMSSACTKCILENVDLRFPVDISVQTLGSNGLSSNSVHTLYRTLVRPDHHGLLQQP